MKLIKSLSFVSLLFSLVLYNFIYGGNRELIKLPEVKKDSSFSIEKALSRRRSIRDYSDKAISLIHISQLLWAGQGITSDYGLRTAPSAGALYPVELYLVAGKVEGLKDGVYKYIPARHSLELIFEGDVRDRLCSSALGQSCVMKAPAVIVISVVFERVTRKYGKRGIQYTYFEAGCVAENIYLQAESLNIGTVVVGAFYDEEVKKLLRMQDDEIPVALLPAGYRK